MADDGALRDLAERMLDDGDTHVECYGRELASALDAASDGGECPHIVTSDEPNPEAVEGLRLLDAWLHKVATRDVHRVTDGIVLLDWCEDHLRPILAAAADPGAAE